jgi:hypothetical protein
LTPAELATKFTDCARACLDPQATKAAVDALQNIMLQSSA